MPYHEPKPEKTMKYQARLVNGSGKTKQVFGAKFSEKESIQEAKSKNPKGFDVYLDTINGKTINTRKI